MDKTFAEVELESLSRDRSPEPNYNPQETHSHHRYFVSSQKRALSQYCASFASSLLMVCFGAVIGFPTILIVELQNLRKVDEDFISSEQLTWIGSMIFFTIPIGAVFSGMISQRLGRRKTLILATFPYIISWILLFMCGQRQLWPIYLGLLLLGCSGGLIESPLQIYVAEISEPRFRGSVSTAVGGTIMIGIYVERLLGKYLDWRRLALVNASFPLMALVALMFVPESPYWLASKGRYGESLKSLGWLRGWSPVSQLPQEEFHEIIATVTKKTALFRSIKRFFSSPVINHFAVVNFAFLVSCFNGSVPVLPYAISVFKQINSPLDEHTAAFILGAIQLFATIGTMIMLPCTGKRKSTLASLTAIGLTLFVAAVYIFAAQIHKTTHPSWVPTVAILLALGLSFLGIKHMPWILTGELFSTNVRSQMAGILAANYHIFGAISSKMYYYVVRTITLPGAFLFFACINFVGVVVLYYVMPETEGKSLGDIERHFIDGKAERKKSVSSFPV